MYEEKKIRSFTDLHAWQEAHILVLETHKILEGLPEKERFALVNQMWRCAISIVSNIAEGFSRKTKKEKIQFYYTSLGSVSELQSQLIISRDLRYISEAKFKEIAEKTIVVSKLINGLIKSLKTALLFSRKAKILRQLLLQEWWLG